ncbi:MAG: carbonic anhydrase [Polyangiales bacterium]
MQRLVRGLSHFQNHVFSEQREFFQKLATGQAPETLFITCSDSRINPNLITNTEPGELFIIRNAGNIIPPHSSAPGGEAATIEYAVDALKVSDIVVCGHSQCGAMKAVVDPSAVDSMPLVKAWLDNAEATKRIARTRYGHLSGQELLEVVVAENVLVQIEHLQTQPAVAAALARGAVRLHAWVYQIESGLVFAFDPSTGSFSPIEGKMVPVVEGRAKKDSPWS